MKLGEDVVGLENRGPIEMDDTEEWPIMGFVWGLAFFAKKGKEKEERKRERSF